MRSVRLFWEYCFFFHKVVDIVKACYIFSALVFISLLSLAFCRNNDQVCKKDSLLLKTLVTRDIRRPSDFSLTIVYYVHIKLRIGRQPCRWR